MRSVSVLMAVLDDERVLGRSLASIREQKYDQDKIEIVVVDGGSRDGSLQVAEEYGAKVIVDKTSDPESAKAVALDRAKGELIVVSDADCVWQDKSLLKKMVEVNEREEGLVGVYPWRYKWNLKDGLLDRYFALLGANDPVAWFLGKADRQSYVSDEWMLGGKVVDKGKYFLVEYEEDELPTVGANCYMIERKLLLRARVGRDEYYHIDVIFDLVKKVRGRFGVVKGSVTHATGASFSGFLKKRKRYLESLFYGKRDKRRYFVYQKGKDEVRVVLYSLYALSIVGPTLFAMRGYRKVRDVAWFLHPLMCLSLFWVYFFVVVRRLFGRVVK